MSKRQLGHVSKFKYLGKDGGEERCRKVTNERKVDGSMRFLVNASCLRFEGGIILYKSLLVPAFIYGSEEMEWRKKEGSRIRD